MKIDENFSDIMVALAKKAGAQGERVRILTELEKTKLPPGVWHILRPILVPQLFDERHKVSASKIIDTDPQ